MWIISITMAYKFKTLYVGPVTDNLQKVYSNILWLSHLVFLHKHTNDVTSGMTSKLNEPYSLI